MICQTLSFIAEFESYLGVIHSLLFQLFKTIYNWVIHKHQNLQNFSFCDISLHQAALIIHILFLHSVFVYLYISYFKHKVYKSEFSLLQRIAFGISLVDWLVMDVLMTVLGTNPYFRLAGFCLFNIHFVLPLYLSMKVHSINYTNENDYTFMNEKKISV